MAVEKKYSVAVADDHAILRSGLAHIINSIPEFRVDMEAADGAELIEKIEKAERKPDVCIMDINMQGMNGYIATEKIKKLWPEIGVLALSQYHNEFSVIKMLRAGAMGYLPKEAGPAELEEALLSIINGCIFYSDLVSEKTIAVAEDNHIAKLQDLNKMELDFLRYCCTEYTYKEIADKMGISLRTVDWYRDKLFGKLNAKSRTGLALFALKIGVEPIAEDR